MSQFSARDFDERYLADMIDPIDDTYMLATLAAQITNKINEAIAVMTAKSLKKTDLTDERPFLPKFANGEEDKPKSDPSSLQRHKAAAAALFGSTR
jgi:hypothetical protein